MKITRLFTVQILAVLMLLSCQDSKEKNTPETLDGVWQSVGYGRIVKIEEGAFKLAQLTSVTCMPVLQGDLAMYGDQIYIQNDTLRLDNGINHYMFTRIDEAPAICKDRDESGYDDPVLNFEVVAETFRDHYAYFKERDIDWPATYSKYRAMVSQTTTDAELYNILADMLDSFDDGHIGLSASDEIEEAASGLLEAVASQEDNAEARPPISGRKTRDSIANTYVKNLKTRVYGLIQWGLVNDSIGYLQLNQMFGYADYGIDADQNIQDYFAEYFEAADEDINHSDKEVVGIRLIMDEVLKDFAKTEAMIIDVRFNGGGSDEIGMEVLSYMNDQPQLEVFSKQAWYKGTLTPKNRVYIAASAQQYKKPVYLLISPESASATEIMTLTSLEIPSVTRVGSETEGVFSDIFDRVMPNGMEFGLSNEVYLSMDGVNYEGKGIPADVPMNYSRDRYEFFYSILDQLNDEGDPAIEYVLLKHQ